MKGVIEKGYEYIRAKAGRRSSRGVKSVSNGRCRVFERVIGVHPSGRFGMCIGEDKGNVGIRIIADYRASSTSKAIAYRIVQ